MFYKDAIKYYSRALQNCPYSYVKERSIMYSNRAACKLHMVGSLHIYGVLSMYTFLWYGLYLSILKYLFQSLINWILMNIFW